MAITDTFSKEKGIMAQVIGGTPVACEACRCHSVGITASEGYATNHTPTVQNAQEHSR